MVVNRFEILKNYKKKTKNKICCYENPILVLSKKKIKLYFAVLIVDIIIINYPFM